MTDPYAGKSTTEDIRARFDQDVDRFSNLETGQAVTFDAPLQMALVCEAAARTTPHARAVLDIGCGAGNFTLKLLQALPHLVVHLIDLSQPMLDRARQRIRDAQRVAGASDQVHAWQGDIREADLEPASVDIVIAAQCLHHLRGDAEWHATFSMVYDALRPGGSFWICDSVAHASPAVEDLMRDRWGDHLQGLKDAAYRDQVLAYVDQEDTPRPIVWQLDLLLAVGFVDPDLLHKHNRFASFGVRKPGSKSDPGKRSPTGHRA